ncbi:hypothetical protein JL722_8857 [Aureococcus anophagefferens]|nr:hypothetical protein JL722_8857 [Aureococcus anophagefferens]
MAAIIVQLKRLREAKRGPGRRTRSGPQIVPLPNAGDVVLDASAYDEEVDDAVHAKRWTLLAAVDELVWGYQRAPAPDLRAPARSVAPPRRAEARVIYANMKVQIFVACLILANFIVSATARTFGGSIVEKQVWPSGQICDLKSHDCLKDTKCNCRAVTRRYKRIFTGFGACFNYIFSVELCWNMYAHWFWLFWGDGWNVFDFITVAVGWITEVGIELPGPLGMLRMVRALRVFRLFKRVKSLRKILESLARAVPGVANAFLIMLITMCIYAILAVDFFQAEGRDGVFHFESGATKLDAQRGLVAWANATGGATPRGARTSYCDARGAGATRFWVDNRRHRASSATCRRARGEWLAHHEKQVDGAGTYYTPRGNEWGHEYFGTFGKSLFTLFQAAVIAEVKKVLEDLARR